MTRKRLRNLFCGLIVFSTMLFVLTSCSPKKSTDANISIKEMDKKIKESIDMINMNLGDEEALKDLYDIDKDELEDFVLYTSSSNIKADELAILKVKDVEKVDEVKKNINRRIDEQTLKFQDYLPEEYYLIEKNILKSKDNYILFVVSEEAEDIEKIFDESF